MPAKTIYIDPSVPDDLRLLCLSVLCGELDAQSALVDCCLENIIQPKKRVTTAYVDMLEHVLTMYKRTANAHIAKGADLDVCNSNYWKVEQVAASLNRFTLS